MKVRDFIKDLLAVVQLDDTIRWYDVSDDKYKSISFWKDGKTVEFVLKDQNETLSDDFWKEEGNRF